MSFLVPQENSAEFVLGCYRQEPERRLLLSMIAGPLLLIPCQPLAG